MNKTIWRERVTFFIVGILAVLGFFSLTGASNTSPVGKYQMELLVRNRIAEVYVMDTTTGMVKWAAEMNTPFEKMKGE